MPNKKYVPCGVRGPSRLPCVYRKGHAGAHNDGDGDPVAIAGIVAAARSGGYGSIYGSPSGNGVTASSYRSNPDLRGVTAVAPNMTEVIHGAVKILYSYATPVAIMAGGRLLKTDKRWSNTTSRHIGKWFALYGQDAKDAEAVSQSQIDIWASNGEGPPLNRNPTLAVLGNPPGNFTVLQFRDAVSRGPYAWPGGYPVGFVTADGGVLCYVCAVKEMPLIEGAIRDKDSTGGWRVVGTQIYEGDATLDYGGPVLCDNCNTPIIGGLLANPRRRGLRRNPPTSRIADKVLAIEYLHNDDGKAYRHDFEEDKDHGDVTAEVEKGGRRVTLQAKDGASIVQDFK